MDESQDVDTVQKKPDVKEFRLPDFIHMEF